MPQPTAFHDLGALCFGSRAQFEPGHLEEVCEAVRGSGVRDLYVVVHGAHNDAATGAAVDGAFRDLLTEAWGDDARDKGMLGVHWPSLCFRDEGVPGLTEPTGDAQDGDPRPSLSRATIEDLCRQLPDSVAPLKRIAELLDERPERQLAFDDFGSALRSLAELPLQDPAAEFTADTEGEVLPQADPLMLFEDTRTMCSEFAGALRDVRHALEAGEGKPARHENDVDKSDVSDGGSLQETRTAGPRPARPLSKRVGRTGTVVAGGPLGEEARATDLAELWKGAHELFRQVVRHVLRRRAGLIGQEGLGPCLPVLAEGAEIRLHLVGHGLGARLAGFALRGLETGGAEPVTLSSLTLLQGEMSHFAFADILPQQVSGHGALWNRQRLVQGPLLCTFSHLDSHLGVLYPLSAQMMGDSAELATTARKWGALGFDGVQGVDGPPPVALSGVTEEDPWELPYLNVDASEVVRSDDVPMGGHHHVFHPEIGRLLRWAAGH
ncbi:hypothetical protein OKJ48_08115 [Streptomyces kunmingensis]|uniref:Serine-threonine protein kinase n=1 Tax=Streptomyces kunmingensis TaxID=68225 RepID=A0ABU6C6T6_9ACTN|nr:hypothetical protein [Streptomyces kunmingensis]MEB3960214.1 hypothetical protein [Streptomyces kunmingensis]